MSSPDLIRYSGLAAISGAALLLISDFLSLTVFSGDLTEIVTTGAYLADGVTRVLAGILLLIGLVGLCARQAEASGVPGLVAFLLAFAGTALILEPRGRTRSSGRPWRYRLPRCSKPDPPG